MVLQLAVLFGYLVGLITAKLLLDVDKVEKFDKIRNAQNVGKLLNEILKGDANFTFDGNIEI